MAKKKRNQEQAKTNQEQPPVDLAKAVIDTLWPRNPLFRFFVALIVVLTVAIYFIWDSLTDNLKDSAFAYVRGMFQQSSSQDDSVITSTDSLDSTAEDTAVAPTLLPTQGAPAVRPDHEEGDRAERVQSLSRPFENSKKLEDLPTFKLSISVGLSRAQSQIFIDGELKGTPLNGPIEVTKGQHELRLEYSAARLPTGYKLEFRKDIVISGDTTIPVSNDEFQLVKK